MPVPAAVGHDNSPHCIRMHIDGAIYPGAVPRSIIDYNYSFIPGDPIASPAPGPECAAQSHPKAEADGRADKESRTRALIDDDGIVIGHNDVVRPRRHNRYIRSA